jgi:hypothetical protein
MNDQVRSWVSEVQKHLDEIEYLMMKIKEAMREVKL